MVALQEAKLCNYKDRFIISGNEQNTGQDIRKGKKGKKPQLYD